jgi:hypothetical protein
VALLLSFYILSRSAAIFRVCWCARVRIVCPVFAVFTQGTRYVQVRTNIHGKWPRSTSSSAASTQGIEPPVPTG